MNFGITNLSTHNIVSYIKGIYLGLKFAMSILIKNKTLPPSEHKAFYILNHIQSSNVSVNKLY